MHLRRSCALALAGVAAALALGVPAVAETPVAQFAGKPRFSEGDALGYFVWKDGDTWKVRWTTFGAQRRFSGRITVEGGKFTSMKRVDVDEERKVIAPGRPGRVVRGPRGRVIGVERGRPPVVAARDEDRIERQDERLITFVTRTNDDIDGVDFKVDDAARVLRFVLEIDGKPHPGEVEVGARNVKPNEHPLIVRLR